MWYLGIWGSKPGVGRKRSYPLWYLATKPLFVLSNHKKVLLILPASRPESPTHLPPKANQNQQDLPKVGEGNYHHLHFIPETLDVSKQFDRCPMNCLCQNWDVGAVLLSASLIPSARVWLYPLKRVLWQLKLAWFWLEILPLFFSFSLLNYIWVFFRREFFSTVTLLWEF